MNNILTINILMSLSDIFIKPSSGIVPMAVPVWNSLVTGGGGTLPTNMTTGNLVVATSNSTVNTDGNFVGSAINCSKPLTFGPDGGPVVVRIDSLNNDVSIQPTSNNIATFFINQSDGTNIFNADTTAGTIQLPQILSASSLGTDESGNIIVGSGGGGGSFTGTVTNPNVPYATGANVLGNSSISLETNGGVNIIPTIDGDVCTWWNASQTGYLINGNSATNTIAINANETSIIPYSDNTDIFDVYQLSTGNKMLNVDSLNSLVGLANGLMNVGGYSQGVNIGGPNSTNKFTIYTESYPQLLNVDTVDNIVQIGDGATNNPNFYVKSSTGTTPIFVDSGNVGMMAPDGTSLITFSSGLCDIEVYGKTAGIDPGSGSLNILSSANAGHVGNIVISSEYVGVSNGAICLNGAFVPSSIGNAAITFISAAGTSYIDASLGTFVSPSDIKLKKNITESELGLDWINSLKPKTYEMVKGSGKVHGFIAQDLEGSSACRKNGDEWGIDYSQFIAPLVKAVQELIDVNTELAERVQKLEKVVLGKKYNGSS